MILQNLDQLEHQLIVNVSKYLNLKLLFEAKHQADVVSAFETVEIITPFS